MACLKAQALLIFNIAELLRGFIANQKLGLRMVFDNLKKDKILFIFNRIREIIKYTLPIFLITEMFLF